MNRVVLATLAVLILFTLMLYRRKKTPAERKKFIYLLTLLLSAFVLAYLTLTGRLHFLVALGAAFLPFLKKLLPLVRYIPLLKNIFQQAQSSAKTSQGKVSTVETTLLCMTLDHDNGHMDGEVLLGEFSGKKLSDLSLDNLLLVYRLAQSHYSDSIGVLEAYMDREIGEQWRKDYSKGYSNGNSRDYEEASAEQSSQQTSSEMNKAEAYEILGLAAGANCEEITAAHRKLMQKLHPDRGGSNYLASKINQAKECLLRD